MKSPIRLLLGALGLLFSSSVLAVDSYRYLHVTIETPWLIFLFLLPIVLSPFIIMAILYWRFASRKERTEHPSEHPSEHQ
ncbi:MAG: hypothetical protein ACE5ET_00340 [Gammaproteobacteria bacterium]